MIGVEGMTWKDHQRFEQSYWGDCTNTFDEERKQLVYADHMGIAPVPPWPSFNINGRNVLDIGGGPVSLLLKCHNRGPYCAVIDPCRFPQWTTTRYAAAGIGRFLFRGEDGPGTPNRFYDEAWIYNVLQHVEHPATVAAEALRSAKIVRVFDWLNTPPSPGHPQVLTEDQMRAWFGVDGHVGMVDSDGAVGLAWWAVIDQ